MTEKKALKLCVGDKKLSVFEKQLSLIDSSQLGLGRLQRALPVGYFSNSAVSNSSSSIYSGNNSTLIGSAYDTGRPGYKIGQTSPVFKQKTPSGIEQRGLINLRIPLNLFIAIEKTISAFGSMILKYLTSYTKEDVASILDVFSMLIISSWIIFGAEQLHYKKDVFLCGVPLALLCFLNLALRYERSISMFTNAHRNSVIIGLEKPFIQLIVGSEFMVLGSLVRLTSIFKNDYLEETSRIDHLVLVLLASIIIGLSVLLFHYTLPDLFKNPKDRTEVISELH